MNHMGTTVTPADIVELRLGHVSVTLRPGLHDIGTARQLLKFYEKQLARPSEPGAFKCEKCGKVLPSSRGLKLHIARKHRKR